MPRSSLLTRRSRISAVSIALVAALSVSACEAGASGELDSVQSVTFPGAYYLTDVVAQEKGFFEDEGLDVDFVKPQSGTTSTQLMQSGQVGLMISDGILTLSAQDKGLGITLVGSLYNRSAWTIYASNADPGLAGTAKENPNGLGALRGKRIGVTGINAGTDLTLQSVLRSNGIAPEKDVNRIGVGLLTAAVGQFENGGLDAYVFGAPATDVLGKDGLAHPFYDVSSGPPSSANVLQGAMLASTKWLNSGNHRDVTKRWIAAHEAALKWIMDPANLEEAGTLFAEAFGGSTEAGVQSVRQMVENIYPHNREGLKVPRPEFDNSVRILQELGQVDGAAPTYDEAVDELGRAPQ